MGAKRSVSDLKDSDLKGKRVFVRVDLNVPLDDNLKITDDTRVRAAVPTIKYLMGHGAKVILSSHLGRPKGVTPKFSLKPLVPRLSELLGIEVKMANDCIGEEVVKLVAKSQKEVAHASTEGVTKYLKPSVAGFLMQKELDYLVGAVANPKKPFAAIVGGSKVSSKIGVIESLLEKVDILLLGGGMIFTFYKAQGMAVVPPLLRKTSLILQLHSWRRQRPKGCLFFSPLMLSLLTSFPPMLTARLFQHLQFHGWMGLDIGPDAIKTFNEALDTTKTVIWNGPMGVFEFDKFAAGTESIAKKLADLSGKGVTTIIGGGDSVAAVEKAGLADKMSHISTGWCKLRASRGETTPRSPCS
ncbi:hypothetical protein LWI28_020989 [Acer negundo]|uniref:Phosphoglycerate kinase n=1 Tax=Acer negundo TaxID=4023 RepID=A0AAD5IGH9_ACENE|nr:hypothetical protein LWI28_020989 [Acer negundo]